MDNAVALVQGYLRVNGYFTVAEYPVIEATRGGYRTATDLDILAFRFPRVARLVPVGNRDTSSERADGVPDPALGVSPEHADMIVGEVKEGRALLNRSASDPDVLQALRQTESKDPALGFLMLLEKALRTPADDSPYPRAAPPPP